MTFFLAKPLNPDRVCGLFVAIRGSTLREGRRHVRLPFRATGQCVFGERGEKRFTSNSLSLAESGMLLEPSGGLAVGQDVTLQSNLTPGPEWQRYVRRGTRKPLFPHSALEPGPREVRAEVLRKDPPDRTAVEFITLLPEEGAAIQTA